MGIGPDGPAQVVSSLASPHRAAILAGMNADRLDFVGPADLVRRDADLSFSMTWTIDGVGINLTGHVIEWKIRAKDGSGPALITLDNAGNGGITLADQSASPGLAYFRLTQAQIAALFLPGTYSHSARDTTLGGIAPLFVGLIEFGGPSS